MQEHDWRAAGGALEQVHAYRDQRPVTVTIEVRTPDFDGLSKMIQTEIRAAGPLPK